MEESKISQVKKLNLENEEPILAHWLGEFKSYYTQKAYRTAIRKYKQALGIDSLEDYVKNSPDTEADIRMFLQSLDGSPSKTISCYTQIVKVFFQDHNLKVPDDEWKKIRRRGFMPKRVRAETKDKKPTKAMLKKILNYTDVKARALILFLISSGARIGETLQLKKEDFDLEAEPPKVFIRREYTKGGVGERTVFFSYEARDAIKDWLAIKDDLTKRGNHGDFSGETVFPLEHSTACWIWNNACDKAGYDIKDKRTGRRIYHLHSLRKFFRTKIGLDTDITSALMGHVEGLDKSYVRLDQDREVAKAYLEAMPNVSVYEVEDQELKQETESLREENEKLKRRIEQLESKDDEIEALKKQVALITRKFDELIKD
jgi:integrase